MIISDWFGEDDMALADIQHDEYWHALKILVQCLECQVDNFAPELLPFLPINRFDHRDLQWLHDLLAACFRLAWLRKHPDFSKQTSLFEEDEVLGAREFAFEWRNAIQDQLDALLVSYPNTVRYVLTSVLWPNPDKRGTEAEETFFRYVIEPESMRLRTESI